MGYRPLEGPPGHDPGHVHLALAPVSTAVAMTGGLTGDSEKRTHTHRRVSPPVWAVRLGAMCLLGAILYIAYRGLVISPTSSGFGTPPTGSRTTTSSNASSGPPSTVVLPVPPSLSTPLRSYSALICVPFE